MVALSSPPSLSLSVFSSLLGIVTVHDAFAGEQVATRARQLLVVIAAAVSRRWTMGWLRSAPGCLGRGRGILSAVLLRYLLLL